MSELIPLLDASESQRTRALLRAGRTDAPTEGYSERLLLALGAGAALGTMSATASAGAAGAIVKGASSLGGGAASLAALTAKWVAVGVLGGGLLAGGVDYAFSRRAVGVEPAQVAVQRPGSPTKPSEAWLNPSPLPPAPAPEPVGEQPAEPKPARQLGSSTTEDDGRLAREVHAVDAARRALAGGNASRALSELALFESGPTTGVLEREVAVVRIEALYRSGQRERARALSEQYRARYPHDAHSARLQALTEENALP
jgi:hypothetical protein